MCILGEGIQSAPVNQSRSHVLPTNTTQYGGKHKTVQGPWLAAGLAGGSLLLDQLHHSYNTERFYWQLPTSINYIHPLEQKPATPVNNITRRTDWQPPTTPPAPARRKIFTRVSRQVAPLYPIGEATMKREREREHLPQIGYTEGKGPPQECPQL